MKLTIAQIAIVGVWSIVILWTIRKIWRPPQDPSEARILAEAKLGGLFITIVSSLIVPTVGEPRALPYWLEVVYWGACLFPLVMWATYFGFQWFHSIVDRKY